MDSRHVNTATPNADDRRPDRDLVPLMDRAVMPTDNEKPDRADVRVSADTECGMGFLRGKLMQKFATQNVFAVVYGLLGCFLTASYAYSNGSITTMEKRFKIPSTTSGLIMVGSDISQLFVSMFLSYYAGKGHRPRWIGLGALTFVLCCLMTALPHFLYGPGDDALRLTKEYGAQANVTSKEAADRYAMKKLCVPKSAGALCEESESQWPPVIILLAAQIISGIGATLFFSVGTTYMDDNIDRNRTPALISFSFFLRQLGQALGFALASVCLNIYISPSLTPTIDKRDPRWLGAWWLGWLLLSALLTVLGFALSLFPKVLPEAAARKALLRASLDASKVEALTENPPSFSDMLSTFKRLLKNRTYMALNAATFFFFFGYAPFWIYMPKYIETQYKQSASFASLVTGAVGLVFTAIGILLAGIVITKYRPTARQMAMWNTLAGVVSVLGMITYIFLGCPDSSPQQELSVNKELQTAFECNTQCSCEYVSYSPVCAPDGKTVFISACHAGCSNFTIGAEGEETFTNCSCIPPAGADSAKFANWSSSSTGWENGGEAKPGPCPRDCTRVFIIFLSVVCILKFNAGSARATSFLVSMRCVEERDKSSALGLGVSILCLFAFIPAPIFAGYLIDITCVVWGKTCSGKGNCWLYNEASQRYVLNLNGIVFVTIGTFFDAIVWYFVKDLEIFDGQKKESKKKGEDEEVQNESK